MGLVAIAASFALAQEVNPIQKLTVQGIEELGYIGNVRRVRVSIINNDGQFAVGKIILHVSAMRRTETTAPYEAATQDVPFGVLQIEPGRQATSILQLYFPPRQAGEMDYGLKVAPSSAVYFFRPPQL